MIKFNFYASGVRKADHLLKDDTTEFEAADVTAAMQHAATSIIPDVISRLFGLESGVLSTDKVEAVYNFHKKTWQIGDIPHDQRPVFSGYSSAELHEAFQLVRPKDDWKNPIDAIVPADADFPKIHAAIAFHTGSLAEIVDANSGKRVTADGYYLTIGS